MPRIKLPGKSIIQDNKCLCIAKKLVFFKELNVLYDKFNKPNFQGSLNQDKINEMYEAYLQHPEYLRAKDNITVGVIDNEYYIIDGQHRFELANEVCKQNENKHNDFLIFNYYEFKTLDDANSLFEELNKDSIKNKQYISSDVFTKLIRNGLIDIYKTLNKLYKIFAKRKSKNGRKYTIEEFVDKLMLKNNYINKFKTEKEIYDDLEIKNKEFYDKVYLSDLMYNRKIFHKRDLENIDSKHKIIYSLKNNNFLDFLDGIDTIPGHKKISPKQKINKILRRRVWVKEFKESLIGNCPICKVELTQNTYHCGHVISEANGGLCELSNLRPICPHCNLSMGQNNWYDE